VYDIEATAKLEALRTLLDGRGRGAVIVFGRTKHGVKKLAQRLQALGYPAAALESNLSQNARERAMASFRSGAVPILLATNVAARGLDVPEVGQVINYELPESADWFTHRVGRTGRMGRAGRAITFLTAEDAGKWRQFEKVLGQTLARQRWPHPAPLRVGPPGARTASMHAAASPAETPSRVQEAAGGRVRRRCRAWWRTESRRRGADGGRRAA
jgi:superfamily II DNA/RNA helicase